MQHYKVAQRSNSCYAAHVNVGSAKAKYTGFGVVIVSQGFFTSFLLQNLQLIQRCNKHIASLNNAFSPSIASSRSPWAIDHKRSGGPLHKQRRLKSGGGRPTALRQRERAGVRGRGAGARSGRPVARGVRGGRQELARFEGEN